MAPQDPKLQLLKSIGLFARCGSRDIERIGGLVDQVDVPAGKVLMTQGDSGHEMFVVVSGRLAVERSGRRVKEAGPGDTVGEMAMLSRSSRTATVTALEPSRLLVLAHREFNTLLDAHPAIRAQLLEALAHRLREIELDEGH